LRAPLLRPNLMLVPVGRSYRPALPISQRAELADAFAQGEARRGQSLDEDQMEQLMELSADAHIAYRLGAAGPDGLQAPAPIAISVALMLPAVVLETLAQGARSWRDKVALCAALFPAVMSSERASEHARRRRARGLGLTAETAPLPGSLTVAVGQMLGRLLLVGIQQLHLRHRGGRWRRVSLSSGVAAAAIRELRIRQDWNAAYRRGQRSA
jgi:hypothetical protein